MAAMWGGMAGPAMLTALWGSFSSLYLLPDPVLLGCVFPNFLLLGGGRGYLCLSHLLLVFPTCFQSDLAILRHHNSQSSELEARCVLLNHKSFHSPEASSPDEPFSLPLTRTTSQQRFPELLPLLLLGLLISSLGLQCRLHGPLKSNAAWTPAISIPSS